MGEGEGERQVNSHTFRSWVRELANNLTQKCNLFFGPGSWRLRREGEFPEKTTPVIILPYSESGRHRGVVASVVMAGATYSEPPEHLSTNMCANQAQVDSVGGESDEVRLRCFCNGCENPDRGRQRQIADEVRRIWHDIFQNPDPRRHR